MSRFDTALTKIVLLVYIGALTPSNVEQGAADDPAGKIATVLGAISAPFILLLVYRNRSRFLSTLRSVTWPFYLVALALVSVLWSVNQGITLRRAIIFFLSAVFAVHLASLGAELRDRLFGWAVVFTVVASFLVVLFLPDYGISGGGHFGEWRGVFDHKNILGRQMVFTFFLALYSQAFRSRVTANVVAVLALVLLGLSRSGTGIAAFGIVLVFAGLLAVHSYFDSRRIAPIFWLIVVPAFLAIAGVGFGLRSEVLQLLGKDESLTGRTTIWAVAYEAIAKRPTLGWGFDVFYTQRELRSLYQAGGVPNHSHNGFLDVIIGIGFVGFAVFLIGFFIALRNAWRVYKSSLKRHAQWPLIFLVMLLFLNFTESNLLRKGTFLWIPYVAMALWGPRGLYTGSPDGLEASELNLASESVPA